MLFLRTFNGSFRYQTRVKVSAAKEKMSKNCALFFVLLELTCTDPGNIQHGTKSHDGFESGKEVKYRCLPGFTMEGSNTLTCTDTGDWDRVKPSCTCKRTNKQAFRYCRKSCHPTSSSCSKDTECVCDGDCGYSCLPKGSYSRGWGIFSLSRAWKKEKVLSFRNDSVEPMTS